MNTIPSKDNEDEIVMFEDSQYSTLTIGEVGELTKDKKMLALIQKHLLKTNGELAKELKAKKYEMSTVI